MSATMPIGTLMRKIHCQPKDCSSTPPSVGPSTGARTVGVDSTPITRPRFSLPAVLTRIIWPTGMIMPPPMPCSTRKPISEPEDQASPHSADPAVKTSKESR